MKKKKKQKKILKIGKKVVKSAFEYEVYNNILDYITSRHIEYETEKFDYTVQHTYLPDFKIRTKSGKIIYIEAKGNGRQFDNTVRQKMIAVKNQHPEIDLRIVFYSDGKIGPTRKDGTWLKQSDWAVKNGFKFSIRKIPDEWFSE